jgi:uncharacterized protein with PQ loop repeat
MTVWNWFSYMGLGFATIYRIPQILKIYRSKRADDLSAYSYLTHNCAYICFMLYLFGSDKIMKESALCTYYVMGIAQNLVIFSMKIYYKKKDDNQIEPRVDSLPH